MICLNFLRTVSKLITGMHNQNRVGIASRNITIHTIFCSFVSSLTYAKNEYYVSGFNRLLSNRSTVDSSQFLVIWDCCYFLSSVKILLFCPVLVSTTSRVRILIKALNLCICFITEITYIAY